MGPPSAGQARLPVFCAQEGGLWSCVTVAKPLRAVMGTGPAVEAQAPPWERPETAGQARPRTPGGGAVVLARSCGARSLLPRACLMSHICASPGQRVGLLVFLNIVLVFDNRG